MLASIDANQKELENTQAELSALRTTNREQAAAGEAAAEESARECKLPSQGTGCMAPSQGRV
jgi:hypothetical protein